jgi:hypothetical protein
MDTATSIVISIWVGFAVGDFLLWLEIHEPERWYIAPGTGIGCLWRQWAERKRRNGST